MKSLLERLIPIRLAFSVGSMRVFAISMFDQAEEELVENTGGSFGFGGEPVDELNPRLEPLED